MPGRLRHVVDVRNERRPQEISAYSRLSTGRHCPYDRNVSRQAIHDLERHTAETPSGRMGRGLYGWDISDLHRPKVNAFPQACQKRCGPGGQQLMM
jgi:hypothetical protein